jgi:hypothetical protein
VLGTFENTFSEGIVSGRRKLAGYEIFQVTAMIAEGSSGAPLLDEHGQVVGVMSARIPTEASLNFAIPIDYVRGLLTSFSPIQLASLYQVQSKLLDNPLAFFREKLNRWTVADAKRELGAPLIGSVEVGAVGFPDVSGKNAGQNLREEIGARFQEDLKALVGHLRGLVGWLRENADLLTKFGQAVVAVAGALAAYKLADKMLALARSIAALNLAALNPYALLGVAAVAAGAAIYAQWKRGQEELEARFSDLERRTLRMQLLADKISVQALRRKGMSDEEIRELVAGRRALPGEETFQVEGPKITLAPEPDLEALKRAAAIRKRQLEAERESRKALEGARRRSLAGFARETAEVQAQIRKWTTLTDERGKEQRIALTRQAWENVLAELRLRLAACV